MGIITQNGQIVLINGSALTYEGSGDIVYESGTYTPANDTNTLTINFSDTHSAPPFYCMIIDTDNDYTGVSRYAVTIGILTYCVPYVDISFDNRLAWDYTGYWHPDSNIYNGAFSSLTSVSSYLTSSSWSPVGTTGTAQRWFVAGRTYKWIAVWAPTP